MKTTNCERCWCNSCDNLESCLFVENGDFCALECLGKKEPMTFCSQYINKKAEVSMKKEARNL